MLAVYRIELRLARKLFLVWVALQLVLNLFALGEFWSLGDSMGELAAAIDAFPLGVRIMFGLAAAPLDTPLGGYLCMYFWCAILVIFLSAWLGVVAVTRESRAGTADFLFTTPVPRIRILLAKVLAAITELTAYVLITGLAMLFLLVLPLYGAGLTGAVRSTMVGLWLTGLVVLAVSLVLASLTRLPWLGSLAAMAFTVAAYGVAAAVQYRAALTEQFVGTTPYDIVTPLQWFPASAVATDGLRAQFVALALAVVVGAVGLAGRRYARREIVE